MRAFLVVNCQSALVWTNLRGAGLSEASLTQTDMAGADLREASLFQTVFGNTTLAEVRGLEQCRHIGLSIVDFQTLKNLVRSPLRSCGA
jgi:uncharacterized protein YjbI with pentapeptide repeats